MVEEFEKDDARKEKEEVSREGYSATEQSNYSKGNQPASQGRPQRPRIHSQRAYSSSNIKEQPMGGFRPEGFGAALSSASGDHEARRGGYRPRYSLSLIHISEPTRPY